MIHNRTICKQVDLTYIDLEILLRLSIPHEPRLYDRCDSLIMLARTRAAIRGANPVEIQETVNGLA